MEILDWWANKCSRKPESPKIFIKPAHEDTKSATLETPYPKILQDGAVENFRPQEVHERVTYAEPLSPPNEQEALAESSTAEDKEGEADWNDVGVKPPEERPVAESTVSYQADSGLSTEPIFSKEVNQHQFAEPNLTLDRVRMTEKPCGFSDEPNKDEPFQVFAEKEDMQDCDRLSHIDLSAQRHTGKQWLLRHEYFRKSSCEVDFWIFFFSLSTKFAERIETWQPIYLPAYR